MVPSPRYRSTRTATIASSRSSGSDLVRWRSDFPPTLRSRLVNQYPLEPVHFAMERKMLLGIKARAEDAGPVGRRSRAAARRVAS
ncbi:MAG: hypothetical protein LC713_05055 [Actinobacteria bacterium]|nr:hypothetical protein [Actinomycetota bacterium]